MIYVIDHNDSFTHNVVHQLSLFDKVECDNFNKINENKIKHASTVVFSPGPGNPKNYPTTSKIYRKLKGKKKMIGICLGFQQILHCEGAKIIEQKKIYHGYQSNIKVINNKSLFQKGKLFKVGRYHSLKLKEPFKSDNFEITMRCLTSKVAMAFENNKDKIYGFQFHPESFLTINGKILIKKILST
ncbi:aminodeoxychorismate/anthranilate synthase component II [Candidatus Pelagibacter communis]|jgi:anthranilate synthase component 2/para-aminobenzoate synthetase component 2|uniref:aminodeoxychorismate/anthranilate synthase component II n=1 Tax=Pelagibacter ubique TaxID=198252 RepID=UPI00094DA1FC|nr:aminodeoxychorismate/anthranilate synthase component II [Candidatus Pelagibacter ubique]